MDLSQFGVVDPQILALLNQAYQANPSLRTQIGESDAGALYGIDPASRQGDYYISAANGNPYIYKDLERNTWGQDSAIAYDMQGNPVGISSGDSTALGLAKFALASLAAYGGVNAADGLVNGATAASTGGAGAAAPTMSAEQAAFLEANMGAGAPMAGMPGSAWYNAVQPYLGTEAANIAYNAGNALNGASTVGSALSNAGSTASTIGNGLKVAGDVLGSNTGSLIGAGLGAVAGAIDSQDKEQTQSREPWKAAQPFLQQLLGQGQQLSTQYQQQPFSQAQRTAYGNMGGLLDSINAQVPGLLGTFNANASGANQFQRGAPRQLQGGGANFSGYMPGLLGNFGT